MADRGVTLTPAEGLPVVERVGDHVVSGRVCTPVDTPVGVCREYAAAWTAIAGHLESATQDAQVSWLVGVIAAELTHDPARLAAALLSAGVAVPPREGQGRPPLRVV